MMMNRPAISLSTCLSNNVDGDGETFIQAFGGWITLPHDHSASAEQQTEASKREKDAQNTLNDAPRSPVYADHDWRGKCHCIKNMDHNRHNKCADNDCSANP